MAALSIGGGVCTLSYDPVTAAAKPTEKSSGNSATEVLVHPSLFVLFFLSSVRLFVFIVVLQRVFRQWKVKVEKKSRA